MTNGMLGIATVAAVRLPHGSDEMSKRAASPRAFTNIIERESMQYVLAGSSGPIP